MEQTVEEKAKAIIADKLAIKPESVTMEKTFKDLGSDSLDTVELIMELENEFNIKINDDEMEKIGNVQDAINLIKSKL